MNTTLKITDPEVDHALRSMMKANNVTVCTVMSGRYFIDRRENGSRSFVTVELTKAALDEARAKIGKQEPIRAALERRQG
jgi:hypothetical protein